MIEFPLRSAPRMLTLSLVLAAGLAGQGMVQATKAATGAESSALPAPLPLPAGSNNSAADMAVPAAPDSYVIGDTDLLAVYISQMPELTRQVRVNGSGSLVLPYLRTRFQAAGATSPQLQSQIAAALVREGLARDPLVQVVVVQVESKPIVVSGAVNAPTTLQAARPLRLLEAISRAGGLSPEAGTTVVVTAGGKSQPYSLSELMDSVQPAADPILAGGESVTVLPAQEVYAVGDFQKPGAFALHIGQPLGVIQVVALAQGLKPSPDKSKAVIIHINADGSRREIPINLARILKREVPNPSLGGGDILYVPENGKRAVMVTALQDAAEVVTLGVAYHFPVH